MFKVRNCAINSLLKGADSIFARRLRFSATGDQSAARVHKIFGKALRTRYPDEMCSFVSPAIKVVYKIVHNMGFWGKNI